MEVTEEAELRHLRLGDDSSTNLNDGDHKAEPLRQVWVFADVDLHNLKGNKALYAPQRGHGLVAEVAIWRPVEDKLS